MTTSLSVIGSDIYRLLGEIARKDFHLESNSQDANSLNLIINEGEKFKTWAVSLGLLVPGHGSLDYRVREAESLAKTLESFLQDLQETLSDVLSLDEPEHDLDLSAEDTFATTADSDEDGEASPLAFYHESIKDVVYRLLRLSTKLRNPSTRLGSSKARNYRLFDADIDLFDQYYGFDLGHVRSMFHQYRCGYEHSTDNDNVSDSNQNATELKEYYLIERIARANVIRRRQFAYWKHHRLKLEQHTELMTRPLQRRDPLAVLEVSAPQFSAPLSISTATQLHAKHIEFADVNSIMSISEYTPSPNLTKDEMMFPQSPSLKSNEEFFECPYCLTTCGRRMAKLGAWKAHLIHDLRPYVCTYEGCKTADQLYDSRAEWMNHEIANHYFNHQFEDPNHLAENVRHAGDATDDVLQDEHLCLLGTSTARQKLANIEVQCTICEHNFPNISELQSHLAVHLERLALFSLPRSTDTAIDEEEMGSNDANQDEDDSRMISANSDLSYSSTASHADDQPDGVLNAKVAESEDDGLFAKPLRSKFPGNSNTETAPTSDVQARSSTLDDIDAYDLDALDDQHMKELDGRVDFLMMKGDLQAAEDLCKWMQTQRADSLGRDHASTLQSMEKLADIYVVMCNIDHDKSKLELAEPLYEEIVNSRKRNLGHKHRLTTDALGKLGSLLITQGKSWQAEHVLNSLLQDLDEVAPPEAILLELERLADSFRERGLPEMAAKLYRDIMDCHAHSQHKSPLVRRTMEKLANLLSAQGYFDEAQSLYVQMTPEHGWTEGPELSEMSQAENSADEFLKIPDLAKPTGRQDQMPVFENAGTGVANAKSKIDENSPQENELDRSTAGNDEDAEEAKYDWVTESARPLVVRQDNNGVQWISFNYIEDEVKMEYTIRCDVESVDVSILDEDFKSNNCVYPHALLPRDQYTGNRLNYETDCNHVGWALAKLNPSLRGKRGVIQRAVDSWRISNQDPRLRSRRVRRQAKSALKPTADSLIEPRNDDEIQDGDLSDSMEYNHSTVNFGPIEHTQQRRPSVNTSEAHATSLHAGAPLTDEQFRVWTQSRPPYLDNIYAGHQQDSPGTASLDNSDGRNNTILSHGPIEATDASVIPGNTASQVAVETVRRKWREANKLA